MFGFLENVDSGIFQEIPLAGDGHLYVSPMPYGPYDTLNRVMRCYRKHHVERAVVLVTKDEIAAKCKRDLPAAYRKASIKMAHFPVTDLTAPKPDQLSEIIAAVSLWLRRERLALHCNAGVGRTGVVVACLAAHLEQLSGDAALAFVKDQMHVNLTNEQERFIQSWAADRSRSP